jgi:ABC-type oligopeptide transport system substrate-binding subunit
MRKPIFQNLKVRQDLSLAFDFETLNKLVFFDALKRPKSLFENTYLAHHGPATEKEKELLKKFMPLIQKDIENGELPNYFLDQAYTPYATKGDGNQRDNLEKAHHLLEDGGWKLKDGKRLNEKGELFTLEFLIKDPKLEKIALSFKRSCQMLGIDIKVRLVDNVQYEARATNHDFDLIVHSWANSLCPGVEQGYYFSQKAADIPGTSNYIGVKDELLEGFAFEIVNATDKETLEAMVHNLDRMIMHKAIFIPLSYDNTSYFAYHARTIDFPEINPNIGMTIIEMGWGKENIGEKNLPTEQPPLMDRILNWFKN